MSFESIPHVVDRLPVGESLSFSGILAISLTSSSKSTQRTVSRSNNNKLQQPTANNRQQQTTRLTVNTNNNNNNNNNKESIPTCIMQPTDPPKPLFVAPWIQTFTLSSAFVSPRRIFFLSKENLKINGNQNKHAFLPTCTMAKQLEHDWFF